MSNYSNEKAGIAGLVTDVFLLLSGSYSHFGNFDGESKCDIQNIEQPESTQELEWVLAFCVRLSADRSWWASENKTAFSQGHALGKDGEGLPSGNKAAKGRIPAYTGHVVQHPRWR